MQKKPYTQPTITDHGDAVEQTKGMTGRCWEVVGRSYNGVGEGGDPPESGKTGTAN
jgi:hypothetical protein